jgi:hypothetical protein
MPRSQTNAKFHVIETDHGYRVVPPSRELQFIADPADGGPPIIEVMNNVNDITIEIEVLAPLIVDHYIHKTADTGKTADVELVRTPKPTSPPEGLPFEVWVSPGNYKIPAESDPRVKPK